MGAKRSHKGKRSMGLDSIPQLPDDICHEGNRLSEEQERVADAVIEAATWQILAMRRANGRHIKEDHRDDYEIKQFLSDTRDYRLMRAS